MGKIKTTRGDEQEPPADITTHPCLPHTQIGNKNLDTQKLDIQGGLLFIHSKELLQSLLVKEFLEAVRGFENLRNFTIQLADDLVYGLLPGRVNIFACDDGIEKLP